MIQEDLQESDEELKEASSNESITCQDECDGELNCAPSSRVSSVSQNSKNGCSTADIIQSSESEVSVGSPHLRDPTLK